MSLLMLLLIIMFLASLPTWPHSREWGYYPSGGLGTILFIVILILLLQRA